MKGELDVERLLAAMTAAWPTHWESSGGTNMPSRSWTIIDPALPSEALAERIAAEYDRSSAADNGLCGDPDPKHPGRSCTIATGHGGTSHGNDHYEWESA